MQSPLRGEAQIQMMTEAQIRARLHEIDSGPRGRIANVGEDERRELLLELERHELARKMQERSEANIQLQKDLKKKYAEGHRIDPNRYR